MIRKEYLPPEMQVIELNMYASLLTMSMPNTLELEINDPTETISGDNALAPIFEDMDLPSGIEM
jgi:hypothetical protein